MKRLAPLLLLLVATPLLAINTNVLRRGDRIGVLRISDRDLYGYEAAVAETVQDDLRGELRQRGFDAFDAQMTFDDLRHSDAQDAAYYVEIMAADAGARDRGGVGIGADNVWATISVVVSRVAAEVRVYDGRTLELVDRFELAKKSTAVLPTSIGIGGRSVWAELALPFVHYGQYRGAARNVARRAAERIAATAQP